MPWIKLDVGFFSHPKTLKLMATDPTAATLHVAAMCWSLAHEQDGHVPESALPLLQMQSHTSPESVDALVEAGQWSPDDSGYYIHDFLEYQESKADIRERRRKEREKKRKQRGASPEVSPGDTDGTTPESPEGLPGLDEMRSDETLLRALEAEFERFWEQYPTRDGKKLDKAKAFDQWKKLDKTQRALAFRGVDNYASSGQRAKDAFRWLRDRCWDDWQTPAEPEASVMAPPKQAVG